METPGSATRLCRRWRSTSRHDGSLVAEQYTIADIGLYAYTHMAHEGGFDLEAFPAIRAWLDLVAEQPGYVPIVA